jgi:subtilase family serine protease
MIVSGNAANVINMSWGNGEGGFGLGDDDSFFQLGIIQGQTFSAGSGDNGAYPWAIQTNGNGSYGDTNMPSVFYPASSPYVIAIGGTTLNTDSNLNYFSESGCSYSGGGVSGFEPIPYWQSQSDLSGTFRQVPDLAFDADWVNSPILRMYQNDSRNVYLPTGGTSLASPLFMGARAVLESANNTLGFAPPLIYPASRLGASSPLHDITAGSNGPLDNNGNPTSYQAGPGYDNVTGLGSFDITRMLAFIGQTTAYTVTASVTGTGGAISPSGAASVNYGATKTYTLAPSTGYSVVNPVGGTCGGTLSGNTYITNPITANCTVEAAFTAVNIPMTTVVSGSVGRDDQSDESFRASRFD